MLSDKRHWWWKDESYSPQWDCSPWHDSPILIMWWISLALMVETLITELSWKHASWPQWHQQRLELVGTTSVCQCRDQKSSYCLCVSECVLGGGVVVADSCVCRLKCYLHFMYLKILCWEHLIPPQSWCVPHSCHSSTNSDHLSTNRPSL